MNVVIGAEAALFPEKEYINGIFFAVCVVRILFLLIGTNWQISTGKDDHHITELINSNFL